MMKSIALVLVFFVTGCHAAAPATPQVIYVTPPPTPQVIYVTPPPTPQVIYVTPAPTTPAPQASLTATATAATTSSATATPTAKLTATPAPTRPPTSTPRPTSNRHDAAILKLVTETHDHMLERIAQYPAAGSTRTLVNYFRSLNEYAKAQLAKVRKLNGTDCSAAAAALLEEAMDRLETGTGEFLDWIAGGSIGEVPASTGTAMSEGGAALGSANNAALAATC